MPSFGNKSKERLATIDPRLVKVLTEAIKLMDFTVLCGHRTLAEQQALYAQGRTEPGNIVTKCDGIIRKSNHQTSPSVAVDIAPWPVDWDDVQSFVYLAGLVMGLSVSMGIPVRWGGDWNRNYILDDDRFDDLPHLELKP